MKYMLALLCASLTVVLSMAGPPFPLDGNIRPEDLSPSCRIPECPAAGEVNLSYPLDCLQYVACENGVRQVKACGPDLHFNKATGVCDTPAKANCVRCW